MEYKDGDIIRYVLVSFAFGNPSWYCDLDDEIEVGDRFLFHTEGKNNRELYRRLYDAYIRMLFTPWKKLCLFLK